MDGQIAVVAGTRVDTQMGMDVLRQADPALELYFCNVCDTPDEQNRFQYGDADARTRRITELFDAVHAQGFRDFFIYCNSLSGSFYFETFCAARNERVVTPLMVDRRLAAQYHSVAVIAANTQSAYNIERVMHEVNPDLDVIGTGMLELVRAVERGLPPAEIIDTYDLRSLISFYEHAGVECLILGCTHFPWFKAALAEHTQIPLIDPADEMYRILCEE